jgi:Mor family transcriptional regulator
MKKTKITLSVGDIYLEDLTKEDIKILKPYIDELFSNLDDSDYERIKKLTASEIEHELNNMTEGELYHFAKTNENFMEFSSWKADSFTLKIWKEIFKRHNLGYKQLRSLSKKQRNQLTKLGLSYRKDPDQGKS